MKLLTRRPETQHQEPVPRGTDRVLAPQRRHGSSGEDAHLEGSKRTLSVRARDAQHRLRIERAQSRADRRRIHRPLGLEQLPQPRVLWGFGEKPVQQRPNVEVGATRHDRQPPAGADLSDRGIRVADKHPGRVTLARVRHIDQVVRYARPRGRIWLRRPDVEPAVDGEGIGGHHLSTEPFGQRRVLELDFRGPDDEGAASRWVFDYAQAHGGLWAGLPRFYDGLDAAYAIGNIAYLLNRAENDSSYRPQALASLQSFMVHAASRNGFTIPEVAGLFPYRLDRVAYERLVREAPWSFGMYDAERYLGGHISFTEPLGAGAGEGLWLIRRALLSETFDENGHPDGGLVLLPCVPADWLAEGREIRLRTFPTYYGTLSVTIRSSISSHRKVAIEYRFLPYENNASSTPLRFRIRLSPPGERSQEIAFVPACKKAARITARW